MHLFGALTRGLQPINFNHREDSEACCRRGHRVELGMYGGHSRGFTFCSSTPLEKESFSAFLSFPIFVVLVQPASPAQMADIPAEGCAIFSQ